MKKIHANNIIGLESLLINSSGALLASNNLSDLSNNILARNNLGLGSSATKDIGINIDNIPVIGLNGKLDDNIIDTNGGYF
jgi:hypothetical protein